MKPKQIAENYRLAARAITEGIYLVCIDIELVPICFKANRFRYIDTDSFANEDFQKYVYKEYKVPAKLVTWWRPKVVWPKGEPAMELSGRNLFHVTKEDLKFWYNQPENFKVLEWESIQAPETYEQCEGEKEWL